MSPKPQWRLRLQTLPILPSDGQKLTKKLLTNSLGLIISI